MGKDRQETKQRKAGQVSADRDQALHYGGATKLEREEQTDKRDTKS
ncbi:YpzI family protein [Aquibacillus sp. 3ASR75-11]|uniref:YpzI family protein n=1 Tax=Terrihalobacillus insolitus TaxID=2950438 RepID=A0A9X4AP01_9BACI|nr:YpzI family protein [Terrihalobacillus insolitus]MDC3414512.1 YpzI family protein [Terrihalobacillus insolitus]MDC3426339.1 YpzI family protein [Terrihalobacillus insolitus]